jgi:hypothetical protein
LTSASIYVLVLFVSTPDPYLAELADLAMDLARDIHRRAKQTPDNGEAVQLTAAFERLARSVRLCRMLDQRLQDERARTRRDDRARVLDHRSKQLKAAVGLAIDEQHGLVQATRLRRELSERLEHDRLFDILLSGSVEQHVERLCRRLGVDPLSEEPVAEGASPTPCAPPSDPLVPPQAGTDAEPEPAPDEPALATGRPP